MVKKNYDNAANTISDSAIKNIINGVMGDYKDYTTSDLTELTHKQGSPWYTFGKEWKLGISDNLIAEYYREQAA